jgi:hypothetical protein
MVHAQPIVKCEEREREREREREQEKNLVHIWAPRFFTKQTFSGCFFPKFASPELKIGEGIKLSYFKSSQDESSRVKSSQVKSSQVKSSQVKSSQVKSSQVKLRQFYLI